MTKLTKDLCAGIIGPAAKIFRTTVSKLYAGNIYQTQTGIHVWLGLNAQTL